jgi:endoglucanase
MHVERMKMIVAGVIVAIALSACNLSGRAESLALPSTTSTTISSTSSPPTTAETSQASSNAAKKAPPTLRVVGNSLANGSGHTIRLLGVNRDGLEYACGEGWGIFDGPNSSASVAVMASWDINSVRLPLNEACWLGLPGLNPAYSGAAYRQAVENYVTILHKYGLIVVLELSVATPNSPTEVDNLPIADAAHAPAFWVSLASTFKDDHSVVFDLFNEPHDIDWNCWRNGCTTDGYQGVGMQGLVDAVRSTGATQPLLLGGVGYAGDLSGWLANRPKDPDHQLVASFHTYGDYPCDSSCLSTVASVAASVPVVTGEFGDKDCTHTYIDSYMAWADAHGVSYLAWTWNSGGGWTCDGGPTLITDYNGTPTNYGIGYRDHLQSLRRSGLSMKIG